MQEYKLFLAGEWVDTVSGSIMNDMNPTDGSVYAKIHTAGPEELEKAIVAAEAAQPAWAALLPAQKESIFLKAADHLEKNLDKYRDIVIDESGSGFIKATGEILECVNLIRAVAGEIRRIDGAVYPDEQHGEATFSIRQPMGVCGGIGPFNYPMLLCLTKVTYGIACGNAFILKPSSDTPISGGIIIAECFEAAGLPKGLLSVLPGKGSVIGAGIVEDPRIKVVAFTGSTEVGRDISIRAAKTFKRVSLEMGGKNVMIVLKDFSTDEAAGIAEMGAYFHQGQICMATGRIVVEAPIYEEFCEKLLARVKNLKMGNPHNPENIIGPLIHDDQYKHLDALIADAVSKGAKLLCGGGHEGYFYEPSLLIDVTPDMRVFREECFGPLTAVVKAADEEEAIKLCNDNDYGLSSALCTNDIRKAVKLSKRMEAGMVHVNGATVNGSRRAPFGGVKNSGVGREGSIGSIDTYTELKWITIQYDTPQH